MKNKIGFVCALILLLTIMGCTSLDADWVAQDRDTFAQLDSAGLDAWIDASGLSSDAKDALHNLNSARRARVKRGCQSVGIPYVVTGTAGN